MVGRVPVSTASPHQCGLNGCGARGAMDGLAAPNSSNAGVIVICRMFDVPASRVARLLSGPGSSYPAGQEITRGRKK
jgi:hypothetical protein